jgi:hypothetical protein
MIPDDEPNPYAPPSVDAQAEDRSPGRRIGWKLYFVLFVILMIWSVVQNGYAGMTAVDLANIAITGLGTLR